MDLREVYCENGGYMEMNLVLVGLNFRFVLPELVTNNYSSRYTAMKKLHTTTLVHLTLVFTL